MYSETPETTDQSFGPYKILRLLGAGAMGNTYLALQEGSEGFNKRIALKKFHPQFTSDPDLLECLLKEVQLIGHLQHPNIVSTFNLAKNGDELYQVMEYVQGVTLADLFQFSSHVHPDILCFVTLQVLMGLQYAHELVTSSALAPGLLHKVISPENVLISDNGHVKLTGFGAANLHQHIEKIQPGALQRIYGYMAPEQAEGKELDARVDLYAVGVMLYEGLTGTQLFERNNSSKTIRLATEAKIPKINTFLPHIHPLLEKIVHKALRKDLNRRYQTAREFYDDMEAFISPYTVEQLRRSTQESVASLSLQDVFSEKTLATRDYIKTTQHQKSVIYVLCDDPVFSNSVQNMLQAPSTGGNRYDFQLIKDDLDIEKISQRLDTLIQIPYAVIFGAQQVEKKQPFLNKIKDFVEITKIIVLETPDGSILEEAINLSGVNLYLEGIQRKKLLDFLESNHASSMRQRLFSIQDRLESVSGEFDIPQFLSPSNKHIENDEFMEKLKGQNQIITNQSQLLEKLTSVVVSHHHESSPSKIIFFQGSMSELGLLDLFQLLNMSTKTATITLSKGGEAALVSFKKGQIIDAKYSDLRGEEALEPLLEWDEGDFIVHAPSGQLEQTIHQKTAPLLLDMLRKIDERNKDNFNPPQPGEGDWI